MSRLEPKTPIAAEEFAARRAAAREEAARRGLDGLLVCSRGGGGVDRYADIAYLTDHYTSFPFIPDLPGRWSGRAHAFLVLPVVGEPRLVIDLPYAERVAMPAGQVVVADLVLEKTAECLAACGLAGARVGLVGSDTLAVGMFRALEAAVPGTQWSDADDVLTGLRAKKSAAEVERLRAASRLGSRMIEAMMQAAEPGATHADVVAAGMAVLIPAGGMLYNSFMASGTGGNHATAFRATFPTWATEEPLAEGQWFRVGISGVLHGYCFDLARSKPIGAVSNRVLEAFEAAIAVVEAGIAAIRPGATAGAVARAALAKQEALGYPLAGVFGGMGHGLGMGWDPPWLTPEQEMRIEPGMVLCVEKTLTRDGYLGDFEQTVLVTADGTELLTDARIRAW